MYTPPLVTGEPGPCGCGCALTPKTSLGFSVIEFASELLLVDLLPWQKWLLVHMLELLPDNSLRFRTVVVLVARQNGKSTVSQVLSLWFMYVYGVRLVLGTAQDLDTAEEVWDGAVDLVTEVDEETEEPVRPELFELVKTVVKVNGKKALVLKPGNGHKARRYKVKAANRRAGRGLSGDVVLLDELREHQSWDSWGALTKTTMARAMALILALSNAGDATSIVLRYLRKMAHAALGDPDGLNEDDDADSLLPDVEDLDDEDFELEDLELDDGADSLAIFEWSAPPGCNIRDRDGWAQANPAMGHVRPGISLTERTVASACQTDPEWTFRTEVLCQWSEGALNGPFPAGSWEDSRDSASRPVLVAGVKLCVQVSADRSTTHIGLAGWRADGLPHVEIIASRAGTDWAMPWLTADDRSEAVKAAPVVVRASGDPSASLIHALTEAGVEVIEWKGADVGKATGGFYDRVRAAVGEGPARKGLRHRVQPVLDVAAANAATKPSGDAWIWDLQRSPVDAAPLNAVTGALWALETHTPEETPPPAQPQSASESGLSETAELMGAGF